MSNLHKIAIVVGLILFAFILGRCSANDAHKAKSIATTERNSDAKERAAEQREIDNATIAAKHEDQINAVTGDNVRVSAACQRLRASGHTNLPAECRPKD